MTDKLPSQYAKLLTQAVPAPFADIARPVLDIALPWPPSLNRLYRATGNTLLLSKEARAYKRAVVTALPKGIIPAPIEGRLAVHITLCPPVNRQDARWDLANREKLLCDVLTQQRIWLDDSQIDYIAMSRGPAFASGRAIVSIHVYHTLVTPPGNPDGTPNAPVEALTTTAPEATS